MSEAAASEPVRVDPRYYADGATWEQDIARRNRNSRALAWIVAAVMTVVAVVALGVIALLVPLKTYEPYMVVVDKATGFVEVKRPMAEGALTQDEAVTTFNVVRYVKARETYDPRALKDNFDLTQLLSTGDAARELTEIYSPANPNNPVKVFGSNAEVAVNIKSVTFPNNRTALVRFSTEEKTATNVVTRNWVSLVRFRYTAAPMRNQWRFDNPLGFQVLEYRRDQETAPSPGSVGTTP
ncbi:virB8 family protein [Ancylobacter dichloromethanicus]|uniref:Type IV secretion system protein virB8 n=1 Tax=Ancylobacter dichloromethanicus TaxID=518825 RepID=A0A9W6JAY9_9HYPH|nr:virB8 family protein [Ancylobacter dichloromethanicus]MBS7556384.1 virB8 family protein [Ancylobacter dichloromethanicus]GLK73642.1 type VI secretion protein [Ancylobacter dichloromethanicus]